MPSTDHGGRDSKGERKSRSRLWDLVHVFSILGVLPTLSTFGARWFWLLGLSSHFIVYYCVPLALSTSLYLLGRRYRLALIPLAFLAWNVALILPLYSSIPSRPTPGPTKLRVAMANVLSRNTRHDLFLAYVRHERPDILLVLEVNVRWANELEALFADYPHHVQVPREHNFGISVFSRIEPERIEVIELGSNSPFVSMTLRIAGKPVHIVGLHAMPPRDAERWRLQRAELAATAEYVSGLDGAVIVIGDLNATSWSPPFRDLVEVGRLRDSRRGFGVQTSWSLGPVHLAIDHILVNDDVCVTDRRVGPDIGSDHRPIIADLELGW